MASKRNFLTLTHDGAQLVNGYLMQGYGYYKHNAYWRSIHLGTGLMVAEELTLKEAKAATDFRKHKIECFLASERGKGRTQIFLDACSVYFANGGTL